MYYPIIDKLKEVMTDITSVKEKEPLVIVGTITSDSGGTWAGEWNDIVSAFQNNKPVYFKTQLVDITFIVPVISISTENAFTDLTYFNNMIVYIHLNDRHRFNLVSVQ